MRTHPSSCDDASRLGRSAAFMGFADEARAQGLDPDALAREAGLPAEVLRNPNILIPSATIGWLFHTAATRSDCDNFAVRVVQNRKLFDLGALGIALRAQSDLRGALNVLTKFVSYQNENLRIWMHESEDEVALRIFPRNGLGHLAAQGADLALGSFYKAIGEAIPGRLDLAYAGFVRAPPRSLAQHEELFGEALFFDQEFNELVYQSRDLGRVTKAPDAALAAEALALVARRTADAPPSYAQEIEEALITALANGEPIGADAIARPFGHSARTLRRKLAAEGLSFEPLLDRLRLRLARTYVDGSERPLTDVAASLGFSSQAAFAHWFKKRFADAASARRKARAQRERVLADFY